MQAQFDHKYLKIGDSEVILAIPPAGDAKIWCCAILAPWRLGIALRSWRLTEIEILSTVSYTASISIPRAGDANGFCALLAS